MKITTNITLETYDEQQAMVVALEEGIKHCKRLAQKWNKIYQQKDLQQLVAERRMKDAMETRFILMAIKARITNS